MDRNTAKYTQKVLEALPKGSILTNGTWYSKWWDKFCSWTEAVNELPH